MDTLGTVQLCAADGQWSWYSNMSHTLTWQMMPEGVVTAGDLHCPVPQGTSGEILTDIIMISHKSISELPGPNYFKEAHQLKSLQLLQPTSQQSSPGKILLSASKTSLDIKHRAVEP